MSGPVATSQDADSACKSVLPTPAATDTATESNCSDDFFEFDDCPNCNGEGYTWGCFEDTCVCGDYDGLGCNPIRCDWCNNAKKIPQVKTSPTTEMTGGEQ